MKNMGITLIIIGGLCLAMGIYFVARPETKEQPNTTVQSNLSARSASDSYEKGKDFEEYVINLLNPADFTLVESVNDYSGRYHSAERNKYCDMVFRDKATNTEFAVECKYRSAWHQYKGEDEIQWVKQEKIDDYNKFARERNISVVVVFGVGGTPSHPADLYSVPLRLLQKPYNQRKTFLEKFRLNPNSPIRWESKHNNLSNDAKS